jgi:hypothetical protein
MYTVEKQETFYALLSSNALQLEAAYSLLVPLKCYYNKNRLLVLLLFLLLIVSYLIRQNTLRCILLQVYTTKRLEKRNKAQQTIEIFNKILNVYP